MLTNITISPELITKYSPTNLGILRYTAKVSPTSAELNEAINTTINDIQTRYKLEDIAKLPQIANTRTAYKAFGKSPSEYRNSAEAMLRRSVKGLGLYQINNVVDCGNLFSLLTGFSAGSYDLNKISGNITLRHATEGDHYEGIGKASVNIGNLPVLFDENGAFGNPCSDSNRTMVTESAHEILSVIYSFGTPEELSAALDEYEHLLKTYCNADISKKYILK
ncbi:MAG: phenylalanine--tRNA ligase beta subunit-related protein [Acetobacter sp.]|nr:phenylalanine--tRNA ligase beta subunit-related protein [Acetobacter sp.]